MIKLKDILAENMLRFGVKNLSESDVTRLTELDLEPNHVEADVDTIIQMLNTEFKTRKDADMQDQAFSKKQIIKGSDYVYQILYTPYDGAQTSNLTSNIGYFHGEGGPISSNGTKGISSGKDYQNKFISALQELFKDLGSNLVKPTIATPEAKNAAMGAIIGTKKQLASDNTIANRWEAASKAVGKQRPKQ